MIFKEIWDNGKGRGQVKIADKTVWAGNQVEAVLITIPTWISSKTQWIKGWHWKVWEPCNYLRFKEILWLLIHRRNLFKLIRMEEILKGCLNFWEKKTTHKEINKTLFLKINYNRDSKKKRGKWKSRNSLWLLNHKGNPQLHLLLTINKKLTSLNTNHQGSRRMSVLNQPVVATTDLTMMVMEMSITTHLTMKRRANMMGRKCLDSQCPW